jgi:rhomboid family GlyGly-CTERM serine protease
MTLPFKNLPFEKQHSLLVGIITLLAILAFLFDEQISNLFVYQHQLISQGELWRALTGHFFHTNGVHLLLNLLALLFLWALHGKFYSFQNYCILFISSALVCSTGLFYFSPEIHQYVGLSGVLHSIFVFGAIMDIRHKDKTGYLLLLVVLLKVAHEQLYGVSEQLSNMIDATVAIDAHLWGVVGGLLFSFCYVILLTFKRNTKTMKKPNA